MGGRRCHGCGQRRPLEISYTIEDLDTLDQGWRPGRAEMRKFRSFLSPEDALRDIRKHASQGADIRWEMHGSRSDVGCACHGAGSLTPREERRHPERGDLRKHHSAEGDKWSLRPDTEHDLRKHLSDDGRMDRWTLQVPDIQGGKQRCTCLKIPRAPTPSPASMRSPESPCAPAVPARPDQPQEAPVAAPLPVQPGPPAPEEPTVAPQTRQSKKERPQPSEASRAMRAKWAVKPHLSLPAERREGKWLRGLYEEGKSKSLKERPKYSVRRSISPDPDPRQVLRLEQRLVRRFISPEVRLADAKWAPYEGCSPLPNVGMRKRETKKLSDIRWQPYGEESPVRPPPQESAAPEELEEPEEPAEPFANVTPTRLPPPAPAAPSPARSAEEALRWRILNQVSAFPLYQGAWREESPPPSPRAAAPTPVWAVRPADPAPASPALPPSPSPSPSPPASPAPQLRRTTLRARKASRARSQGSERRESLGVGVAAAGRPEPRARPQLLRSKALLEVPHMDASKRSLSEEVRSHSRAESTRRGPLSRAKSEDAPRARGPEPGPALQEPCPELREYVTTV